MPTPNSACVCLWMKQQFYFIIYFIIYYFIIILKKHGEAERHVTSDG